MKKRTLVAVALAVIFTLALTAPVFAQDMTHSVDYDLEGTISLKKHVGHLCNTGAEMKQVISGAGTMTKSTDAFMKAGYLTVDDDNDWIAAATSSLSVTSAIKLCMPAKHIGGDDLWEGTWAGKTIPVDWLYKELYIEPMDLEYEPLTKQIWAAQITADPGYSGNMHTNFAAAHGPIGGLIDEDDVAELLSDNAFVFVYDPGEELAKDVALGKDFVGNYFTMDAWFRTSMGTTKRFVSLSSPFSHAYLTEDITVVGRAEVKEALSLMNLPEGQEATTDWWDLF